MEFAFVIYLIDSVSSLKGSFWGLSDGLGMMVLAGLVTAACTVIYCVATERDNSSDVIEIVHIVLKKYISVSRWFIPLFVIGSLLNTFLPTTETAYKMLAAYGVQETVQAASKSDEIKRIASKSLSLVENAIDNYEKEYHKNFISPNSLNQKNK